MDEDATGVGRLEDLREQCRDALRRIAGLAKLHDSEWLALDLGMGQFKGMVALSRHGRLPVGGLARALSLSEPSASLLVDKLVSRGLVVREADTVDRRRTLVTLTAEGEELLGRLRQTQDAQVWAWLGHMEEEDLRMLCRGLKALRAAIEAERARAASSSGADTAGLNSGGIEGGRV